MSICEQYFVISMDCERLQSHDFLDFMHAPEIIREIKDRYLAVSAQMNERSRRRWAAAESRLIGWGGISAVSKATGISPNTIRKGLAELSKEQDTHNSHAVTRLRKPGAGRKPLTVTTPELLTALDRLTCDPGGEGSNQFIKWTGKTPNELAAELSKSGLNVSARTVSRILNSVGYSCPPITRSKAILARSEWPKRFIEINRALETAFNNQQPVMAISIRRQRRHELPEQADRPQNKKPPQIKVSDRVLKEIELAVQRTWDSIVKQKSTSKTELLILIEFFLSDPLLRSMEAHLREPLNVCIRSLSMPPAIRIWNTITQQTEVHKFESIDEEAGLLDEMTIKVIGS